MWRATTALLAKQKKKTTSPGAVAPTVIHTLRGYKGRWQKVHLLPDLRTYGQEGHVMKGLQIFQGLPDPVVQPRSYYPPGIFQLAKMPLEPLPPKPPVRMHKPKTFAFKPARLRLPR